MAAAKRRVLIVDDDESVRFGMRGYFETRGFDVTEASSVSDARTEFELHPPDSVVVDFQLPDGSALDLLPNFKHTAPDVPLVLLSGYATIDRAVRAMQAGAEHFLTKPVEMPVLAAVVERAIETRRLQRRQAAEQITNDRHRVEPFIGDSEPIRRLRLDARRVLASETPVLIYGPTGAGKGVLASWLHTNGLRAQEPFVDINCASLSREFLETELFGHRKGAFTGALNDKPGLLEVADGGTVFLDEIGDMDLAVQPKLLKVVEQGSFRRLGEVQDRHVDVRLIAATHHDLGALVRQKKFRDDLYFRINAFPLHVPALKDRREDIPLLAESILERLARDLGQKRVAISEDAERVLCRYDWPGNIRELRNVLERGLLRSHGVVLDAPAIVMPADVSASASPPIARRGGTLDDVERDYIEQVLREEHGLIDRVATRLGVSRSAVYYKARKHNITISKSRI